MKKFTLNCYTYKLLQVRYEFISFFWERDKVLKIVKNRLNKIIMHKFLGHQYQVELNLHKLVFATSLTVCRRLILTKKAA